MTLNQVKGQATAYEKIFAMHITNEVECPESIKNKGYEPVINRGEKPK